MDARNVYTHDKHAWMLEMYTLMTNMHGYQKRIHSWQICMDERMYIFMANMHR